MLWEDGHSWASPGPSEGLVKGHLHCVLGQGLKPRCAKVSYDLDFAVGSGTSPRACNVSHRQLGAGGCEKEMREPWLRAAGLDLRCLGRCQVFRDLSPQGTNSIPVPAPPLNIKLSL